jgi:hypothetical protein
MSKRATQQTTIVPDETAPEVLASAITEVQTAARKLLNSRLTERAIIMLIHDHCGERVGKREIKIVLESAANLGFYVRPAKKP